MQTKKIKLIKKPKQVAKNLCEDKEEQIRLSELENGVTDLRRQQDQLIEQAESHILAITMHTQA